ncbi:MAG TPA: CvpA family protein [Chitinivibrionales bacterium]|nr:CvpA family protein [Chitinivibrionales bacterium]
MHLFDIICAGLACVFVLVGIWRGFVEEIVRLVAVVAAFFAAFSLYRPAAAHLKFLHLSGAVLSVIAFLAIFTACVAAVVLLGKIIKKVVHLTVLGWMDRMCGGVLGFVKVFILIWILVIAIASLPFDKVKNWFRPSKSYAFFSGISPRLRAEGLMPKTGPVQDLLKANPLPAIKDALHDVAAAADSAAKAAGQTGKPGRAAAKPAPKPPSSTGAK